MAAEPTCPLCGAARENLTTLADVSARRGLHGEMPARHAFRCQLCGAGFAFTDPPPEAPADPPPEAPADPPDWKPEKLPER